jgi:predicted PurR-regulated permease PerM
MNRVVSFVALIGIVILVSVLVFQVMASFLLPMFLAIVMVVVFRPMHEWIVDRCNGRNRVGSVITTALIMVIVLAPLLTTTILAVADLYEFLSDMTPESVEASVNKFREETYLQLPEEMRPISRDLDKLTRVVRGVEASTEWENGVKNVESHIDAIKKRLEQAVGVVPVPVNGPPANPPKTVNLEGLNSQIKLLKSIKVGDDDALKLDEQNATERLEQFQRNYNAARPGMIEALNSLDAVEENDSSIHAWLTALVNPSRQQLEDVRASILEQLGMGALAVTTGQYVSVALGKLFLGLFVMVISLYYFLADGPAMIAAVMSISPLEPRYGQQMLAEFVKISRAVVMAIVVAAVVQGTLATIGYWIAGLDSLFLLCVLTTLLAMIPFVGAASVWIPCSLYLVINGNWIGGVCLALYGFFVVSMIDNLIKPMVLHGQSKLHPLLALLSIIGGVQALGPIGIFVGPMVVSFLQAVLNMFHAELKALGSEAAGGSAEKSDDPDAPPPPRRRRGRG